MICNIHYLGSLQSKLKECERLFVMQREHFWLNGWVNTCSSTDPGENTDQSKKTSLNGSSHGKIEIAVASPRVISIVLCHVTDFLATCLVWSQVGFNFVKNSKSTCFIFHFLIFKVNHLIFWFEVQTRTVQNLNCICFNLTCTWLKLSIKVKFPISFLMLKN